MSAGLHVYGADCGGRGRAASAEGLLALKNRLLSLMEGQYADVKAPVLGPAAAQVVKVMGRYRYHLTMRARDSAGSAVWSQACCASSCSTAATAA